MKKLMLLVGLLCLTFESVAQEVDNFEVGPYDVKYNNGEVRYRIRENASLSDYPELLEIAKSGYSASAPINQAWQVDVAYSSQSAANGQAREFGFDGAWKKRIGKKLFFNAGVSLEMQLGKYGLAYKELFKNSKKDSHFKETIFEFGVPLSIEFTNLDRNCASLYFGAGLTPKFYSGGEEKYLTKDGQPKPDANGSGFLLCPRADFGGYIPYGGRLIRVGIFLEGKINCSGGDYNIYKERIGTMFFGGNIGLVF